MSARYFQGASVYGPVKESAARTFREVVDTMRICPTLGITRAAFLKLDKKQRNEIKQVPFFVPACFKESPSKRDFAHGTVCNLIFLDIDPEMEMRDGKWTETGKYPAAPFYNNPEAIYSALADFNFAAHVTASSTPEKPRMRIAIDAEAIPLALYSRAVTTIGMLLGLTVTTESKVAVQPMFLPTLFSDSPDDEEPLIAYQLDAKPFQVSNISESDSSLEYSGPRERSETGIDALEFLRAPVPEISLSIAKEALSTIDPDCDFHEWTHVAMALRHQFSPRLDEEAYELFDDWSRNGAKYGGEDETRKKWKFVYPTSRGRSPITIRSLLHEAVKSGWDDKKVKESCFNALVNWLEQVGTITELMENGVKKILSAPLLSAVQEDVLVHMLCTQARKRFAYTISATAIRKDLARIKAEIKSQDKPKEERTEDPAWAKSVIYCSCTQEFYRYRTGEKYKSESFNASYSRWLLPTKESLTDAGSSINPVVLSKPFIEPSVYALNHLKIPTVYDYAYDPSQPNEVWFVNRGRRYVNTYSPTYPQLDPKGAEAAGNILHNHLGNLIAEPEYRKILLDYMAYMVQFPGKKIRWTVLLQSTEGAGKTVFAKIMQAVLGFEHVKILSDGAIQSGYNEWAFGHQMIIVEEIYVSGVNRHMIMNKIKPLITNDDVSVDEKFRSNRQVLNISNYMLFSNHHDALALTPNDRRYFVVKSPLQSKYQVLALGENYFPPLYNMLRDHPGAVRSFLADWEISSSFNPDGHAPRTTYVNEMVNDSAGDLTASVRRLLLEGDYPLIQYDIVTTRTLINVLQLEENMMHVTDQQLSKVLQAEGFTKTGRHLFGTEKHYLWVRDGASKDTAFEKAADRVKRNLKNLSMELIYG